MSMCISTAQAQNACPGISVQHFPDCELSAARYFAPSQPASRPAGGPKTKPASQRGSQAGGPKTTANEINECNE
jgi:hypothetical protein